MRVSLVALRSMAALAQTYRLSSAAAEQDTNRILLRTLSFNVFIMVVVLFFMLFTGQLAQPIMLVTVLCLCGLWVGLVAYLTIRRARRMLKNAVETFELTIDDQQITRTQREAPTIVVPRSAVKRISERAGQGFKIETANWNQCIWVPRELEGYEEVKTLLLASSPEQPKTMRHPLAITYGWSLLFVAGFLTVMYSQRKSVVTATGAAVLCFYIYYVAQLVRTWLNLSRPMKRILWVMFSPAIFVALRIAAVWR